REFTGNDASLRALAFNSEATSLITVSADGSVRLGDPLGDEDAFDEIGNVGEMTSAVFSSHGDTLATFERPGLSLGGPQDVKILVWRTDDLDSEPVGISVDEEPLQFAVSDDGRWLVTIQQQGGLRLWDLATSEQISLPMPAPANDE